MAGIGMAGIGMAGIGMAGIGMAGKINTCKEKYHPPSEYKFPMA
jgi:hypothetical protein